MKITFYHDVKMFEMFEMSHVKFKSLLACVMIPAPDGVLLVSSTAIVIISLLNSCTHHQMPWSRWWCNSFHYYQIYTHLLIYQYCYYWWCPLLSNSLNLSSLRHPLTNSSSSSSPEPSLSSSLNTVLDLSIAVS